MDLTYPEKPPIEIEIYRPSVSVDCTSVSGMLIKRVMTFGWLLLIWSDNVALVLDRLNYCFGPASRRQHDSNDDASFSFIKTQLDDYIAHHSACGSKIAKPLLPHRVIWLEASTKMAFSS